MIIRPQDRANVIISGAFIFVSLLIVAVSIFLLNSERSLFRSSISLNINVANAQNLKRGAEVQLRGIKIGSITNVEVISLEHLRISIAVDSRYQNWIKTDSFVAFKTQGMLGDRYLEILGGSDSASMVKNGDNLSVQESNTLDKFINKGEDILVVAGRVLQKMDHILGPVENNRIDNILGNLERTTASTQKLFTDINSTDIKGLLTNLTEGSKQMKESMTSVSQITKQIEQGPGTLNSLIYDRSVHDDLQTILGGTKRNRMLQYFIRESLKKAD